MDLNTLGVSWMLGWLGIFIWGYQNLPPEHTAQIAVKLRAKELATIDIIIANR